MGRKVVGISEKILKKSGSLVCTMMLVFAALLLTEMMITPNVSAGTVPPVTISTDTTWDSPGNPYWIEYDVTVQSGATLTIKPGVEVRFNGDYSLIIDGNLSAIGEPTNNIVFTSNLTPPSLEDWQSIRFNSWNEVGNRAIMNTIKYAIIEYATYGVHCHSRSIALENSTIRNNTIGIYSTLDSAPYIANNTISNNTQHGIAWSNDPSMAWKVWEHIDNTILNNTISYNGDKGINLVEYAFPNIAGNTIFSNDYGIYMNSSSPWAFNNTITDNAYGIYSHDSSPSIGNGNIINNNTLDGIHIVGNAPSAVFDTTYANLENNTIDNNTVHGVIIMDASEARLRNNTIANSSYNFGVWADTLSEFNHDIDDTNMVNTEPIYYWRNHIHDDEVVPLNAGYVGIVNSTNISAENLTLTHNGQGVLVAYSNYSNIDNVTASDNELGTILFSSSYNTIENSNISSNDYNSYYLKASGIYVETSSYNNISNNMASLNQKDGITIDSSNDIVISNNTLSDNQQHGLTLWESGDNIVINNIIRENVQGIVLFDSNENNISDNNITWIDNHGILLQYSSENIIYNNSGFRNLWGLSLQLYSSNNVVHNNTFVSGRWGIALERSSRNNINDNNASLNEWYGIDLWNSDNNTIGGNNVSQNSIYGIYIRNLSGNNNVTGNNISSNTYDGIYSAESTLIDIYNNNIGWNGRAGINCKDSSTATITYNDILSNDLYGVWSQTGSDLAIHNNTISRNTEYGVKNIDDSIYIHAEWNYWGASDGPVKDDGGEPWPYSWGGSGDEVSNYVYFYPYLSFPP